VRTASIQIREVSVLRIEHKGEVGSGKQDGIQFFALDQQTH
jgi:hypothetical protein